MKNTLITLALLLLSSPLRGTEWSAEQQEIIELNRWVPLALHQAGFDAYAGLFHPDYTNWYMGGDRQSLRDRAEYLSAVRDWFEAGNYADYSRVVPISVEVMGDIAYMRHLQEEHFRHADGSRSVFVGQFASLLKKHEGRWVFYRTSFQERYRGPAEGAERLPPEP